MDTLLTVKRASPVPDYLQHLDHCVELLGSPSDSVSTTPAHRVRTGDAKNQIAIAKVNITLYGEIFKAKSEFIPQIFSFNHPVNQTFLHQKLRRLKTFRQF